MTSAGQVSLQCKVTAGSATKLVIKVVASVLGLLLLLGVALLIAVKWKQLVGDFAITRLHRIKRRSVHHTPLASATLNALLMAVHDRGCLRPLS